MDKDALQRLLHSSESTALDFKRDQYRFQGGSDEEKSELLKDILALANSERSSDAFILIGVEELSGGRSRVVGVETHLDDASLQQFVNSKTQRPVRFSYEPQSVGSVSVGVIRLPLQRRPIYLKKNFGRLRAGTVYVRRGSSTAIATPDEVYEMGVEAGGQPAVPDLALEARVVQWDTIVLSIVNKGEGPARSPYVAVELSEHYRVSPYGIDRRYSEGFLGAPRRGGDPTWVTYGGSPDLVLPPGARGDFAALQYNRDRKCDPVSELCFGCEIWAENVERVVKTVRLSRRQLLEGWRKCQNRSAGSQPLPTTIRNSGRYSVLTCRHLDTKAHRHLGEMVCVRNATIDQMHPLPFGYTWFSIVDGHHFDCAYRQGEPIEDVLQLGAGGNFYGVVRDDQFNYPYLLVTEYEKAASS